MPALIWSLFCAVNPQPENRFGNTVKQDSAFDSTTAAPTIRGQWQLISSVADRLPWHTGSWLVITDGLLVRMKEEEHLRGWSSPPPHPDRHHHAQTTGVPEHQAELTHCQWRHGGRMRGGNYQVMWFSSVTSSPLLWLPSNNYPYNTKVLIVKACEEACTLIMSTTQTVFSEKPWRTQYSTRVCKQNVQETNAWLWYMCNRVVLIYSYRMNLIFLLVAFSFRKKQEKNPQKKSGCQASVCLFFLKRYFCLWF